MITGRGGMGSHKHGVSGVPGRNARFKAATRFEAMREEKLRKRKRPPLKGISVHELIEKKK